jgi:purine-nucleoside phosphorylase
VSTHLSAEPGAIAERVLLPGDPLRAQWVAETFLDDASCYSSVRNMFGYTGTFEGVPVSVQGTGMGIPSMSIYAHELFAEYGVRTAVRIGTAGALRPEVGVRDVVLAQAASTDSGTNRRRFPGVDFAAVADFGLLSRAHAIATERDLRVHVGGVLTSDLFYGDLEATLRLAEFGVLAVEMETNALYTLAAQFGVRALSVLTISDHLLTKEETSADERQRTFGEMVEVALRAAVGEPGAVQS